MSSRALSCLLITAGETPIASPVSLMLPLATKCVNNSSTWIGVIEPRTATFIKNIRHASVAALDTSLT